MITNFLKMPSGEWHEKLKVVLSKGCTICSILCVLLLGMATLYWVSQPRPSKLKGLYISPVMLHSSPGGSTLVPQVAALRVSDVHEKIVCRITLVDNFGVVRHEFDDVLVLEDPEKGIIPLGDLYLKIPPNFAPGLYTVAANIIYQLNPIKTNSVYIELAKISIGS